MSWRENILNDPFSTALDRAVAHGNHSLDSWTGRIARASAALQTPAERAELSEYWRAVRENELWNAEQRRAWERKTHWSETRGRFVDETDGEWRQRTAALKWKRAGDKWIFIGGRT